MALKGKFYKVGNRSYGRNETSPSRCNHSRKDESFRVGRPPRNRCMVSCWREVCRTYVHDQDPKGSSCGSAVAVRLGLCVAALGTEVRLVI